MKVLKLTFEIPLGKSAADTFRKAVELVATFKQAAEEAKVEVFAVEEVVVTRPGRD